MKRFYSRTNKVFRYVRQVTGHERRVRLIQSIKQRLNQKNQKCPDTPRIPFDHDDPLPVADPFSHYQISKDRSRHVNISSWANDHKHDAAVKVRSIFFCLPDGLFFFFFFKKKKEYFVANLKIL